VPATRRPRAPPAPQQQPLVAAAAAPAAAPPRTMPPRRAPPRGAALALALLACLCMATAAPAASLAVDMSEEAKEYAREAGHAHWHGQLHRLASVTVGDRRMGDLLGPILRHKYELPPAQVRMLGGGRGRGGGGRAAAAAPGARGPARAPAERPRRRLRRLPPAHAAPPPRRYPSIKQVQKSLVYLGTNQRLRRVVHDLMVGKDIRVGAIGGSITHGAKASKIGETDWFRWGAWVAGWGLI
jgi:hypothetical protein